MLQVDPDSNLPIYIQIKEQIKHLIYDGDLVANAPLPSANLLSQILGVNRNTVLRAYRELQDEGFATFQPGRGTFVSGDATIASLANLAVHTELVQKIDDFLCEALTVGMSRAEIASLMMLRLSRCAQTTRDRAVRVAFVECNPERMQYYVSELTRELGVEVVPLLVDDLTASRPCAKDVIQKVDFVISPFFHLPETRTALQKLGNSHPPELLAITIRPQLQVAARLANLPRNSRVAIMYLTQDSYSTGMMTNMVSALQRMDLPIELVAVSLSLGQTDLAQQLATFDAVMVQPENIQPVADLIPPHLQVIQWANVLDEASLEMLRTVIRQRQPST